MDYCYARDFMFCSICGTRLSFDSLEVARCRHCGFERNASELIAKETTYIITAEDIRRELKLEPFVLLETAPVDEEVVQRAVVNEACPQCHNPQLEYHTKQLRSADEGQTVFYECPKCGHKFSINT
ncbi:DNA-directed RNA polymerase I subunit RPA12-like [Iris pallida]|uniref:DNA-directed RNA polymerase subunit n=1 Tax=Iris pallida TaxID=29817 RepID=A0AAX6EV67_IRIPA|nr:DNA-directed RNA polymerase I subunit RPA12-like [Iris pallida]